MNEKSRHYNLLISTILESNYFNSLNKNARAGLLCYMNSESFKKDFDKSYDKIFGLETTANTAFIENLVLQTPVS